MASSQSIGCIHQRILTVIESGAGKCIINAATVSHKGSLLLYIVSQTVTRLKCITQQVFVLLYCTLLSMY